MDSNYQVRRRRHRQLSRASPQRAVQTGWNWRKIGVTCCVAVVIILIILGATMLITGQQDGSKRTTMALKDESRQGFPVIETTGFSATQLRVLYILQQEYANNPVSYDKTVKKYTEGFEESWCADFISWVFHQADTPFVHPETEYWRIPGVQTLVSYYQELGAYHELGDGYVPKMGDIAFYFGETPDGGSSEHVAMVLEVRGNTLVTIGGNEGRRGVLQVRYDALQTGVKGLVAIGASGIEQPK